MSLVRFSFDEEKIAMLKSGFQPCTIAYKNWNPNVKPLSCMKKCLLVSKYMCTDEKGKHILLG